MELKQSLHAIMKLNQSNKHSSMAVIIRKWQGLDGLLFMCCVVWIISKFFQIDIMIVKESVAYF